MRNSGLITLTCTLAIMLMINDGFAQNGGLFAQNGGLKDSMVVFQGCKVTLRNAGRSADTIKDPVTGSAVIKHTTAYKPIAIDGVTVRQESAPYTIGKMLQQKIAEQLTHSRELQSLADGRVQVGLDNIVVAQQRGLVYYQLTDIRFTANGTTRTLRDDILTQKMLAAAVQSLSWKPDAPYVLLATDLSRSSFIVKGGKVTFVP